MTVLNRGGLVRARATAAAMVTLHGNATWEWEGVVDVDLSEARAGNLRILHRHDDEVAAWARVAAAPR